MDNNIIEALSGLGNAAADFFEILKIDLGSVKLLHIIFFALWGGLAALICRGVYLGYKKFLLWLQTSMLRRGEKQPKKKSDIRLRRQSKGLVAVLAVELKNVLPPSFITGSSLEEIYFADKNGDYHDRNTKLPEWQVESEVEKIHKYYKALGENTKLYFPESHNFKYEEICSGQNVKTTPLWKKFIDIYSKNAILAAIDTVNSEMESNNAVHFIGDKIGVRGYSIHEGNLTLDIYRTDHFTWQVFKQIFKTNKPFFQEVILRINKAPENEKKYLVNYLAFLFSSFGIDIIIEGKNSAGDRKLILTARSGKIEKNKESSLHVSVNETFSRTDAVENKEQYGLVECVKRGIEEEIGIPQTAIPDSNIKFHDFAIVTDEGEIGLSCFVDLTEVMPVEKMLMYPGQDKFWENEELILMPYFKISHIDLLKSVDSKKYMHQFYKSTMYDRFSMPWMSFTPLLISRVLIRNIEFSRWVQFIVRVICWVFAWLLIYAFSSVSLYLADMLTKISVPILEQIVGTSIALVGEGLYSAFKRPKNKYKYIQPLISQWYSNAKVLQATGVTFRGLREIGDGLSFDLSGIDPTVLRSKKTLELSYLVLEDEPYCSVRRKKNEGVYTEKPVSRYKFKDYKPYNSESKKLAVDRLYVLSTNIQRDAQATILDIRFDYKLDDILQRNRITKISFVDEVDIELSLPSSTDKSVSLYNLSLPESFNDKYELLDLFKYKDNYYWSCITSLDSKTCDYILSADRLPDKEIIPHIYKHIESNIKEKGSKEGSYSVRLSGTNEIIEQWLCEFISHPSNKRRISELEIYMLQLLLIKHDMLLADCKFRNSAKYKTYYTMGKGKK